MVSHLNQMLRIAYLCPLLETHRSSLHVAGLSRNLHSHHPWNIQSRPPGCRGFPPRRLCLPFTGAVRVPLQVLAHTPLAVPEGSRPIPRRDLEDQPLVERGAGLSSLAL